MHKFTNNILKRVNHIGKINIVNQKIKQMEQIKTKYVKIQSVMKLKMHSGSLMRK